MLELPVDIAEAIGRLAAKYAVDVPKPWKLQREAAPRDGAIVLAPGWTLLDGGIDPSAGVVPLLPWRFQRRFVELKRLVESRTVEPVVMCRLSCVTTGAPMGLKAVLYRELDLVEWLTDSPIVMLHASIAADRFANVLVQTANGVLCSVEAGATLPPDARPPVIDRHEIIAGRGVASDRVVDTQVPQQSVYTFTGSGAATYTDSDAELFGLEQDDIDLVRAAWDLASRPEQIDALATRHRRLAALVELAYESDRQRQRLGVEGVVPCNR